MERNKNTGLLIIGAGGHGKVVADVAETMGCYETIIFADDDAGIQSCLGYPVFHGKLTEDEFLRRYDVFAAVGKRMLYSYADSPVRRRSVNGTNREGYGGYGGSRGQSGCEDRKRMYSEHGKFCGS